jgi:putative oxidoreductase
MNAALALLGRVLMSAIFIQGGWGKLTHLAGTATYIGSHDLPLPYIAAIVAVVVELGGGLAVLIGLRTRIVAVVLALWCIATAMIAHYHPGDANQMIHFMKNVCMAGGFLILAAWGAGALSVDRR